MDSSKFTKMKKETLETKKVLIEQWTKNTVIRNKLHLLYKENHYTHFATIARGSSDHASLYLNYLIALKLKKLTISFFPSLASIHNIELFPTNTLAIAISQSGKSPDLVASLSAFKASGCHSLALINAEDSPMTKIATLAYPLKANKEEAVAATKSFIASIYASASLVAKLSDDIAFIEAVKNAPNFIPENIQSNFQTIISSLLNCKKAIIVGRGLSLAIAQEAALKLKETCHIQAEAFSSAEVLHGPQAIIDEDYTLIIFAPRGPEQKCSLELAEKMRQRKANVFVITDQAIHEKDFQYKLSSHPYLDPLNIIYDFYLMVEELTRELGLDPDSPRFLSKVTMTV